MIYPDLKEKKILVTGASRGIGKAICEALAKQNAHIVFNYRGDDQQANELKEHFEVLGATKATAIHFDVTDYETMKKNLDQFVKSEGPISGLVNNAGISKDQLSLRVKPSDIEQTLNINLKAAMVLTNHLSRNFLKAKDVSIVNMSSVVGLMGNTAQTVYAASKAGLIGYTKSYAKEYGSRHFRCNAICPGFIETEMTKNLEEKAKENYIQAIPLGKYGDTEDVANLTLFLLSRSSKYITGEVIKVDGGLYI
ncbi:MAG: 3-oxoacyl-ACP reductase FabG [Bacteriovoracaceae bacterium]|jgi:3-oxoacyl-[acyl-carrier protein] reductase|nr:3-oxoacyl-ACP reductase FabG [Bacteriovoracaceae bacterium]